MLWCQTDSELSDALASTGPFVKLIVEHAESNTHTITSKNKFVFIFIAALRLTTPNTGSTRRINTERDQREQPIHKRILRLHLHHKPFATDGFHINRMIAN